MIIRLELWQLLMAIGALVSSVIFAFWLLTGVIVRQAQRTLTAQFKAISDHLDIQDGRMDALEKTLTEVRIAISRDYVRRDDYVRDIGTLGSQFQALAINVERMFKEAAKDTLSMIKAELRNK